MRFETLARNYGSGYLLYSQSDILTGNRDTNPYLAMSPDNNSGVCLGLAMGFLLYSRRFSYQQPLRWISEFVDDTSSGYEDKGNFHNVSDLQTFIGCVMQDQGALSTLAGRTRALEDGMWNVSLKYKQSKMFHWSGEEVIPLIRPHINSDTDNAYWLIAATNSLMVGHAMALRSMVHPTTGFRLLIFFEPNYGVVQFQGVTSIDNFRKFLNGFACGEGRDYFATLAELYRFS
ncbi:hypothetical protein FKG94_06390 [Exilibacterium tricleocarpae]|uniref:Peptidase C58 YopT-type domain-containing protein n=1 Tax=Exilibacterium tricleocarpae TaxID=2591008 RepID=A0A545U484_9GAMM|nr:YopT-type cysteine protease domain-containing protein [Exilibacterium tricleocarpae]TQV84282.1 hypothetical protein FKG94_06390 [Exilibacterium tricleocarpae]